MAPIQNHVPGSVLTGIDLRGDLDVKNSYSLRALPIYLFSFLFFPVVLYQYLISKDTLRKTYHYGFDQYWLVYGSYIYARLWLKKVKPTGLVFANDHSAVPRAFTMAAQKEGILTFYVPHASITTKFPPLIFDYAFLDGFDSLKKYEICGPSQTISFLSGTPKSDPFVNCINQSREINAIGICTNHLDLVERVVEICGLLRNSFPNVDLKIRPHPSDKRKSMWEEIASKYSLQISDSKKEVSFSFLSSVDAIIAGNSNILLEAALLNVLPIYYDFPNTNIDWYGFEREGLVKRISNLEDLNHDLKMLVTNRPFAREKAKRFCATIGTSYDGRSAELVGKLISEIVDGDKDLLLSWKQITDTSLEAYELKD